MAELINSSWRALFKIWVLEGYREFSMIQREAFFFHVVLVLIVGGDSA